jgi:hypothetical protein
VVAAVSSMKTSCFGSRIFCSFRNALRAGATSGRSCSAARRLFFKGQVDMAEEPGDRLRLPQPPVRANRRNKASPFMTGPFVPVRILNPIRAVVGIPHHRFNPFVECSSVREIKKRTTGPRQLPALFFRLAPYQPRRRHNGTPLGASPIICRLAARCVDWIVATYNHVTKLHGRHVVGPPRLNAPITSARHVEWSRRSGYA